MLVGMAVRTCGRHIMVMVVMTIIVCVGVLVLQFLMHMLVLVRFSQVKDDTGQHQRTAKP